MFTDSNAAVSFSNAFRRALHRCGYALAVGAMLVVCSPTFAQLCPAGYYNPNGGLAAGEILCSPGTYTSSAGATAPTPAPAGSYVATSGATFPTLAPAGTFVSSAGQSGFTNCPSGFYAPTQGTVTPTAASPGFFVPTSGATSQTPASPGFFVPNSGASAQQPATPGFYVPSAGASSQTPASPGFYVPSAGASAQQPATPGFYVPGTGASSPTGASPGHYVPAGAATGQLIADKGYYVSTSNSPSETPAPIGTYVSILGAISPTPAPAGTWTHIASFAPRSASIGAPRGTNSIVGPIYQASPSPTIDLTAGPASLNIANISTDLGVNDDLTALTIESATLSGGDASLFALSNFTANTVLFEQGTTSIDLQVLDPGSLAPGTYTTTLTVVTDQTADFGATGDAFNYTVSFTAVPEPASLSLLALTTAALFRRRSRRQQRPATV